MALDQEKPWKARTAVRELLDDTAAAVAELHPDLHVTTEVSRSAPVPGLNRAAGAPTASCTTRNVPCCSSRGTATIRGASRDGEHDRP